MRRKKILSLLICLWILSGTISAATLPQYRAKIEKVYDSLEYLLYPEEDLSDAEIINEQRAQLKEIRATLLPTEKIDFEGASFDVDNSLLLEKLRQFENEKLDSPNREKLLNEVSERLSVLENKLAELEKQAAPVRSKDEDKRKLTEILNRAEYQKPEKREKSFIQKAIDRFFSWLDSLMPKPSREIPGVETASSSRSILQTIVFIIALGIIGFLLYRFAPVLFKNFRRRAKPEKTTRVILGETLAADETSKNLFDEAENLARAGNLRAAIRKGYIALLCELSDRKIIGLAHHKTNRDYLRDVRKRKNLYQEMSGLTTSFERHWYGFDQTEETDWQEFREQYKQTVGKDF